MKPLLAGKIKGPLEGLNYPVFASPKLDGIRCLKINGRALTRSLKPIPNKFIRDWVEANLPDGIDGELLLRDWTTPYRLVSSAVMNRSGSPDFTFAAFDLISENGAATPFEERIGALLQFTQEHSYLSKRLRFVPQTIVPNAEQLRKLDAQHVEAGYEGTMIRDPRGRYKFGRSGDVEGILLKLKTFDDEEATVIGAEELMSNQNEAGKDLLGHTERSTKKAGLVPMGKLGALHCRFADGAEFTVGSGFTEEMRVELWAPFKKSVKLELAVGKSRKGGQVILGEKCFPPAKIRFQGPRAKGEAPRFPVFVGFRHPDDA